MPEAGEYREEERLHNFFIRMSMVMGEYESPVLALCFIISRRERLGDRLSRLGPKRCHQKSRRGRSLIRLTVVDCRVLFSARRR